MLAFSMENHLFFGCTPNTQIVAAHANTQSGCHKPVEKELVL